jgi:cystathionine beta-lyase/cystathionine gamma-synthase
MTAEKNDLLKLSIYDLCQDQAELGYLFSDYQTKWHKLAALYPKIKNNPNPLSLLSDKLTRDIKAQIRYFGRLIEKANWNTASDLDSLTNLKREIKNQLRYYSRLPAALASAVNWQSPTFAASFSPQAGFFANRIEAGISDYTRDNARYVMDWEIAYRNQYIGQIKSLPAVCYATSSGMAAFTTILMYLLLEHKLTGQVIVGRSVYFETKELLKKHLGKRVIEISENDLKSLENNLKGNTVSAVFLDTIGNTPQMLCPDLTKIAPLVRRYLKNGTLVIDNTVTSISLNLMRHFPPLFTKNSVIAYESLNKFHQYGLDQELGGVIWAYGKGVQKLFDYRGHLGTILPDKTALSLPTPNRKQLRSRITRIFRNAGNLASFLSNQLDSSRIYHGITYPTGPFLMLDLPLRLRTKSKLLKLTDRIIKTAKKAKVTIHAGTSFGLDTTRVYPTALMSSEMKPFFRIAPGTETASEINKIKYCLLEALTN